MTLGILSYFKVQESAISLICLRKESCPPRPALASIMEAQKAVLPFLEKIDLYDLPAGVKQRIKNLPD